MMPGMGVRHGQAAGLSSIDLVPQFNTSWNHEHNGFTASLILEHGHIMKGTPMLRDLRRPSQLLELLLRIPTLVDHQLEALLALHDDQHF